MFRVCGFKNWLLQSLNICILLLLLTPRISVGEGITNGSLNSFLPDNTFLANSEHHDLPTVEISSKNLIEENPGLWKIAAPTDFSTHRYSEEILFTIYVTSTCPLYAFYEHDSGDKVQNPSYFTQRTAENIFDPSTYIFKIRWEVYFSSVSRRNSSFEFRSNVDPFFGVSTRFVYDPESKVITVSTSSNISENFYDYFNWTLHGEETSVCGGSFFVGQRINPESGVSQNSYHCAFSEGLKGEMFVSTMESFHVVQINDPNHRVRKSCWKWCHTSFHCNPQDLWFPGERFQSTVSGWCVPLGGNNESKKTLYSTPIIVSLPQGKNQTSEIYLSREDVRPEKMINLKKFEERQYLNTVIELGCTISVYYASAPLLFALKHKQTNELEFLPVGEPLYKAKQRTHSRTHLLKLDSVSIERIFCFAPIHSSYDWINASRPVQVLDCSHSPSQTKPRNGMSHPWIDLLAPRSQSVIFSNSTFIGFNLKPEESPPIVKFQCVAPYPIRLKIKSNMGNSKLKVSNLTMQRQVENFYDSTTYTYVISVGFELGLNNEVMKEIYCTAFDNHCLAASVRAQTAADSRLTVFVNNDSASSAMDDQQFSIEESDCEFLLYYESDGSADLPTYALRCELDDGTPGAIETTSCDFPSTLCIEQFRLITQPAHCTRKYRQKSKCNDCPAYVINYFEPLFVRCKSLNSLKARLNGNFLFFGIPSAVGQRPVIYFDEDDIDPKSMILMNRLEEVQYINTKISVKCQVSKYYTANPVIFALQYSSGKKLQFIQSENHNPNPNMSGKNTANEYTAEIFLNSTSIQRIYCFAALQKSSGWINQSIPVEVKYFLKPTIVNENGIADESQETMAYSLQVKKQFQLGSENESLTCTAKGVPLPRITWIRNHVEVPESNGEQRSDQQRWSELIFPKIDKTAEGIYICKATNIHGKAEAIFNILVFDKSGFILALAISIPTVVIFLIAVGIMAYLIVKLKFYRNFRRNALLTDEEYEEFMNGSLVKNNADPHSSIFNEAFDPKYIIPRDKLTFECNDLLGAGNFGVVMKGWYNEGAGNTQKAIAVKTIKRNVDAMYLKALLSEVKIMAHLDKQPNIVEFLGACIDNVQNGEIYVAVEFCHQGDLLGYLRKQKALITSTVVVSGDSVTYANNPNSNPVSKDSNSKLPRYLTINLLKWSCDIASGLSYLSFKHVIHGDLAARNVLITDQNIAKISDFGLSRQLLNDYSVYMKKSKVPLPWKWMALESIANRSFSVQSDVWSYGVTLWEMFALGDSPYPGMSYDEHFIAKLSTGYRSPIPEYANVYIYSIMLQCWQKDPKHRPAISSVYSQLQELLQPFKSLDNEEYGAPEANYLLLEQNGGDKNPLSSAASSGVSYL